jgi:hypothetical protein
MTQNLGSMARVLPLSFRLSWWEETVLQSRLDLVC